MADAPSITNYYIGKGTIEWTPEGGVATSIGNCPRFEFTPNIETLDHFSSQAGVRSKDRSVTLEKSGTLALTTDEFSVKNLQLAFMGADPVAGTAPVDWTMELLANDEIRGAIAFTGTNTIGPKLVVSFPLVSFKPSSTLGLITDEWGEIELEGEVLLSGGSFGTLSYTDEAA